MSEDFGFTVKRLRKWDRDTDKDVVVDGQWCVHLPHQCDAWDIAGEATSYDTLSGESHEDAIAALEAFIAQAQEALVALKEEREHGAS